MRLPEALRRGPEITVVVPAFDVGEHLGECLASVAEQQVFGRTQVVVVDDGSTDTTPDVARRAAARWPQVEVVHQTNRGPGPGAARNVGLSRAQGRYVLFLDGDDVLVPGGLDALHRGARASGADVVVGALRAFPEPKAYPWDAVFAGLTDVVTRPVEDVAPLVHNSAPGNKLLRRDAVERLGLRFAEGIHHQDTYVTLPMLLLSPVVTVIPDVVQLYRRRPGSIMDSHFTRQQNFFDHLQVVEHLSALRPSLAPARREVLDTFLVRSMQGFLLRAPELDDETAARELVRRASLVYQRVSATALASSTRTLQHRLAYAAVLRGDWDALVAAREPVRSVFAHEGRLYAGRPADVQGDEPDPLTRAGAVIATLDAVTADAGALELTGTVRVKGTAPVHELGTPIALRLKGAGLTEAATLSPADDGRTTRWCVRLPGDLAAGSYSPRLVVSTVTGQVSTSMRAPDDISTLTAHDDTTRFAVTCDLPESAQRLVVLADQP